MYLVNALIVLAIMALVIPAVLFAAYIIGAATLPPIFNAVNNATPTPTKFQRQKEVFDAWQYIMTHHHNLRGHYIWDVREKYNLTQNELLPGTSDNCDLLLPTFLPAEQLSSFPADRQAAGQCSSRR